MGMLVAMDVVASEEGRLWGGVALLEEEVQGGEGVPKGVATRVVDAHAWGTRRGKGSGGVGGARPALGVGPDS